jgi:ATP-dependent DNA helicase RecQ
MIDTRTTNYIDDEEILPIENMKEGFTYYYYFEYYPIKFKVSDEFVKIRKLIWTFKDGGAEILFGENVSSGIDDFNLTKPISDWWLCVIPASTKDKTVSRFKNFCIGYSKCGINNGFELVKNLSDRESIHLQENRGAINILDAIDFGNVTGKNILLFDDIYTTGKSFLKVARRLKSLGAVEVVGLFLGKTHWHDESSL